jgi:DNA mismatch repair protein MutS
MLLEDFQKKYFYSSATPVMRQYLDIKYANIDCLILFRMGDFYELFFEDAIVASRVLGIALTKRGKSGEDEIPMCGVPYHALDNYLNKLLENDHRVAICDQTETPQQAKARGGYKAVVHREITRIITPGTIIEESLIVDKVPNYLISMICNKNNAAICYLDLSTSEISVTQIRPENIFTELMKLAPKEILLPEDYRSSELAGLITKANFRITYQVSSLFAINKCQKIIENYYGIISLKAIGEMTDLQISCVGSILEYVNLTQKQNSPRLQFPKIINSDNFMAIDAPSRRNLELAHNLSGHIKGSLFGVMDHTVTKAGSRLLYKFLANPLLNIEEIERRLKITEFFYSNVEITEKLKKLLARVADLARCLTRISMNKSTPRDLLSVKNTLIASTEIKAEFLKQLGFAAPDYIEELILRLSGDQELFDLIDQSIKEDAGNSVNDGEIIKHDYHPKIAQYSSLINDGKTHIDNLKKLYQKETGIDGLKISHNNVIGLFIDITPKQSSKITDTDKFLHRQTTITSIRYTTLELQKLESEIMNARSLKTNLEIELYNNICEEVFKKSDYLWRLAENLARLDTFAALGSVAYEYGFVRPELSDNLDFEITGGRHPNLEIALKKSSKPFVSNDCKLAQHERIWLITGPNMSGKSTFLRQNAIIAILAQIGSFVPATSAKIGIVDKIFSRIGSGDDLLKGQSTFMVEMLETSAILAQSTNRSLIILDEVGRGTSTYDGVSIAWSVLEYVHDELKCRCLFASHYHELTTMSNFLSALKNYTVAIEETRESILFLHKIIPGTADKSYGIHVAQLAGLPTSVVKRANELLLKFEKTSIGQRKNILKDETNNLSLFEFNTQNDQEVKYNNLKAEIENIEPDSLTPKQALEVLYKLKNSIT